MDHPDFGFLNLRIQTWLPFQVQFALNGREWLGRQLDKTSGGYQRSGNKFLSIENLSHAQVCLDRQVRTDWPRTLNRLLPIIFPTRHHTLGKGLEYYWTLWQSEWATDLLFQDAQVGQSTMEQLLRHALMTGTSERVMRYLARPLTSEGKPYASCSSDVQTRICEYHDGIRIKHWADKNSTKIYNEQNVVRFETTINDPSKFRVMRAKQGASAKAPKERLPMRKGVADIAQRAAISHDVNKRVMDHVATFTDPTPLIDLVAPVSRGFTRNGRRTRALDLLGKDRELLMAIADPRFSVNGVSNPALRSELAQLGWGKEYTTKQLSARISRHLRLLHDHRIIRKMPRQHRYQLTEEGRKMTTALIAALNASTKQLMTIAA